MQIGRDRTVIVLTGNDVIVPDMTTLPAPAVEMEIPHVEVLPCSSSLVQS